MLLSLHPVRRYLERQIVKRMENVKIEYDGTVRDRGQIVQFVYGGDGLDGSLVVAGKAYDDVHIAQTVERLTRRNPTVDWAAWGERERAERAARAKVAPGEMVGCLAAQSISEPATQMVRVDLFLKLTCCASRSQILQPRVRGRGDFGKKTDATFCRRWCEVRRSRKRTLAAEPEIFIA